MALDTTTSARPATATDRYREAERALWAHYGLAPTERFVDIPEPSVRLRVVEVGAGEPVVFLPGTLVAGPAWGALVRELPDRRCLLVDPPGVGLSAPVAYPAGPLRRDRHARSCAGSSTARPRASHRHRPLERHRLGPSRRARDALASRPGRAARRRSRRRRAGGPRLHRAARLATRGTHRPPSSQPRPRPLDHAATPATRRRSTRAVCPTTCRTGWPRSPGTRDRCTRSGRWSGPSSAVGAGSRA